MPLPYLLPHSKYFASIMGHAKVVEFLLENGADINSIAASEVSAMWLAASEGRSDVMKILAKYNADATNTRVDGITALMTAAVSKFKTISCAETDDVSLWGNLRRSIVYNISQNFIDFLPYLYVKLVSREVIRKQLKS